MINRIHGGDCLKEHIIDFSVNINPLGLPKGLAKAVSKNVHRALRYPHPSSDSLKRKLSALHGVKPENIAIGNGSIELIYLAPRVFEPKKALVVAPTFSEYEFALESNGLRPHFFNTREEEDFRIDFSKIKEGLPRSAIIFLCNPNNPTGSLLHADEVLRLFRMCEKRLSALVVDEAFIEFTGESAATAIVSEAVKKRSLLVLRSLTKFFAIPGLRLGYAIGHKETIEKNARLQYPWNVNSLAQLAGEKVLEDKSYIERTRSFVAKEGRYMFEKLCCVKGLKAYPPSANFLLCKLKSAPIRNSGELTKRLLRDGIYIRNCCNFRGLDDRFFRVAVRRRSDNNRLIASIQKALR